ncbi:hypothetical protein [Streptomyces canus]|uniref:hypothetical protein n=1 Tax=Streptomyces canus TaxID=58343 RepID=UPI0033B59266
MSTVRYRKLPVEVDTVQWTGDNLDELIAFTGGDFLLTTPGEFDDPAITAKVYDSLHDTWVGVKTGQVVVQGVKGETYPIDADVLAETYELVTEPVEDTLAAWLAHRFDPNSGPWDGMSDDDRSHWEHEAAAVRRAAARGGFKNRITTSTGEDGRS